MPEPQCYLLTRSPPLLWPAGLARRVQSVPSGLHRTGNANASASAAGGEAAEPAKRGSSASALSRPDKETGG